MSTILYIAGKADDAARTAIIRVLEANVAQMILVVDEPKPIAPIINQPVRKRWDCKSEYHLPRERDWELGKRGGYKHKLRRKR